LPIFEKTDILEKIADFPDKNADTKKTYLSTYLCPSFISMTSLTLPPGPRVTQAPKPKQITREKTLGNKKGGWISHLWFEFGFAKFTLKMSNFSIFFPLGQKKYLWVGS